MKFKATFYHAGCPVCFDAERQIVTALDPTRYDVEVVHLVQQPVRISQAAAQGVKSVPALVLGQVPLHINFNAALKDLG